MAEEDGDDDGDGGSDGEASASGDGVLRPVGPRLWLGAGEREDPATDPEFRQAVSGEKSVSFNFVGNVIGD